MKRLIGFILSGCFHKWETIENYTLTWKYIFSDGKGERFVLRCEKCGEITKRDIK